MGLREVGGVGKFCLVNLERNDTTSYESEGMCAACRRRTAVPRSNSCRTAYYRTVLPRTGTGLVTGVCCYNLSWLIRSELGRDFLHARRPG